MQWVCRICGYVHDDDEVPEVCPVCGAFKGRFTERYEDEENLLGDEYCGHESDDVDDFYGDYDE